MPEKQRPLKLFLVVLAKRDQQDLAIFLNFFNITIIPFTLVGYEVIIANSALRASLAISCNNNLIMNNSLPGPLSCKLQGAQGTCKPWKRG